MRTMLLGDVGNQLDIADNRKAISAPGRRQQDGGAERAALSRELEELREAFARQALTIQALTRFLIGRGIVDEAELLRFVDDVDAEDGIADGKLSKRVLRSQHPPLVVIPEGTYRQAVPPGT